jgi:hypothetical protein
MKDHYQNRVKKLESKEYPNSINPRTTAKSVLNVMEHFELKSQNKLVK